MKDGGRTNSSMKRAAMTHMPAKKLLMLVGDYPEDYEVMIDPRF